MKVRCSHGYFFFQEDSAGELARFGAMTKFELTPVADYYTFADLKPAKDYSIAGVLYQDLALATETFQGTPWDVMRKNKLVYDFTKGLVVPIASITLALKVSDGVEYFHSDGLILPGSISKTGKRVTDYSAHFSSSGFLFRYSEIFYDQTL